MLSSELLGLLVCPETKQRLSLAGTELLARLNRAVEEGTLVDQGGNQVTGRIEAGLVREDGRVLYPVRDDIPVMLLEEAIRLDSLS